MTDSGCLTELACTHLIHALWDEPVALPEQLAALAATDGARLTITGREHPLSVDTQLALYRAAQEALSNARKHAPGGDITMQLSFDPAATVLVVSNGRCPAGERVSPLVNSGSGFGLGGMRERIELLGGSVRAEPEEQGWTVHVQVPA
jgi:signal transduction histidine kinase